MTQTHQFGRFLLNPATRELHEDGVLVVLPARAFDCLAYLILHRDRAVGRDELIAAVWGRVEVSEALLSHTILKIRRGLGDTGNGQRTIRTVPRFGYRWVGAIDEDVPPVAPAAPDVSPASIGDAMPQVEPAAIMAGEAGAAIHRTRPSPRWIVACVAVVFVAAAVWLATHRQEPAAPIASVPAHADVDNALAMPALVLPAQVTAPDDWRWLRFGLMDLVANRLRDGALPTMSSESVVNLLKQRVGGSDDLLHDPALAKMATLRVLPTVRLDQDRWTVRLDAFGSQRSLSAEAQGSDAIKAGRDAADALLRKLGRSPDVAAGTPPSPAIDDLLQRSGAAMLADQLDEARRLLEGAPPGLRENPRIEQRMAQIELRAGDYAAVETRLHALLDRLSPERDGALRARALLTLAAAYVRQGDSAKVAELYEEAIALRKDAADHEVLGVAYLGRGVVFAQGGQFEEATTELSRARIELETIGDGLGVAGVDVNLGDFQLLRHRPADALPILRNAVREFERLGAREGIAHALAQTASAEREMLELAAALATTERFWPGEAHTSNLRMRWTLSAVRATALADVTRFDEAGALIARIGSDSDPGKDAAARAQASATAAALAWFRGDVATAARLATVALTPALGDADPSLEARTRLLATRALRQSGRLDDAAAVTRALRASADRDDWRAMIATIAEAEQDRAAHRREPALEKFALAMRSAERYNVPEDLVTVAASYIDALIEASQLDTARAVGGRIATWADRDPRAATAQARLYRALGRDDAARKAEESAARLGVRAGAGQAPVNP